jgi:hypothetical protein
MAGRVTIHAESNGALSEARRAESKGFDSGTPSHRTNLLP